MFNILNKGSCINHHHLQFLLLWIRILDHSKLSSSMVVIESASSSNPNDAPHLNLTRSLWSSSNTKPSHTFVICCNSNTLLTGLNLEQNYSKTCLLQEWSWVRKFMNIQTLLHPGTLHRANNRDRSTFYPSSRITRCYQSVICNPLSKPKKIPYQDSLLSNLELTASQLIQIWLTVSLSKSTKFNYFQA